MLVYTFHVRKGGTGKTTNTANVAHGLALRGLKVCIIDTDTQANLTTWLAGDRGEYELADVMDGKCSVADAIIPIHENLDILGTAEPPDSGLQQWVKEKHKENPFIFREVVRGLKELGYQAIFIDVPPTFFEFQQSCYLAVDEVIASVMPKPFEQEGAITLVKDIAKLKNKIDVDFNYRKIVANAVDAKIGIHKEHLKALYYLEKNYGYFTYRINSNTAITGAQNYMKESEYKRQEHGTTIYNVQGYSNDKIAIKMYKPLVDDIYHEVAASEGLI